MPALWVLAVLALVALLLLSVPLGLRLTVRGREITLDAQAAFLRLRLYPRPVRKPEKKRPKRERPPEKPREPRKSEPFDLWMIPDGIRALPGPALRGLGRILRGIRVEPLEVYFTAGGKLDPARAADLSGRLLSAIWTVMPTAEQLLTIPDPLLYVSPDFDAERDYLWADVGLRLRLGTVLSAVIPVLFALVEIQGRSQERREAKKDEKTEKAS